MKVFVINLKQDDFKRDRAIKILNKLNVDFTIIEAIDGSLLELDYLNSLNATFIEKYRGFKLKNAEVGVYLSHLEIYKQICSNNIEYACILEDDFYIKDSFKEIVSAEFISKLKPSFDIIMLGHFLAAKSEGIITKYFPLQRFGSFSLKEPLEFNYGAHGYIISNRAAEYFLINFHVPKCPIDNLLGLSEIFGLKRLVISPPVVYQSVDFDSTIQNNKYQEVLSLRGKINKILKTIILNISGKYKKYNLEKYKVI